MMQFRAAATVLVTLACSLLVVTHARAADTDATSKPRLLDSLHYYEVVPLHSSTHTLSAPPPDLRAHLESVDSPLFASPPSHPHVHRFSFRAHEIDFDVQLEKNVNLFGAGYSESRQYWTSDGVRHKAKEPPVRHMNMVEHCYYQGSIVGGQGGKAGIQTCDHGFTGMISVNNQKGAEAVAEAFVVEPAHMHLTQEQLHAHVESIRGNRRMHTESNVDNHRDGAVNPYSLHIVYKLRDTREFQAMINTHSCGVGHPDVEAHTASSKLATTHQESLAHDVQYEHQQQFDAFRAHFGVMDEDIAAATAQANPKRKLADTLKRGHAQVKADPINPQRYVELLIANDQRRYASLGQSTESRSAAIVNQINTIYTNTQFTPALLQVVLIGQTTFFYQDPWNITTGGCTAAADNEMCVDKLLSTWNAWRRNPDNTAPYDQNDAGHLYSGYKFQGSVLGYAGVGAMCITTQSGGIDQMTDTLDSFNAIIGAHELGHNLGMQHDSNQNTCPSSGYIMNAIVTRSTPPTAFSSCSLDYYNKWTVAGSGTCLNNVPTQRYGAAVCGNGYVEDGEACDCGPYNLNTVDPNYCNTTSNPCCDALSCQFISGATCSNTDPCCTNCHVSSASEGKVCREATGFCDLRETCDGTGSTCPFDDHVGNGLACTVTSIGAGACFEGDCLSYAKQCNAIGTLFPGGPWITCSVQAELNQQKGNGYCGELFCGTSSQSSSGSATTCTYFDFSSAPEQMDDGNPCGAPDISGVPGNERLCYKGSCVAAELTNTRYQWFATDWAKCSDCNTMQNRTVSCIRISNGKVAPDVFCTAGAKPAELQQCSDDELLCDNGNSGVLELTVFGNQITISSAVVIGTSLGIFFFLLLVLAVCVQCVGKRDGDKSLALTTIPKNGAKKPAPK